MTDCAHNDKRACFHERLEMSAEIERLKSVVARLGEIGDVCTYEDLNTVCSTCQCKRKTTRNKPVTR
jgi:hypothetical protein